MCGIVGYLGKGIAQEPLIDGLRRLEYRGYDSAGVAFHEGDSFSISRETGRVENLSKSLKGEFSKSGLGIAHTRWATHGAVTVSNTHPHLSHDKKFALVHNGVIENFSSLKNFYLKKEWSSILRPILKYSVISLHSITMSCLKQRIVSFMQLVPLWRSRAVLMVLRSCVLIIRI